jgi:hypothetical protein
MRAASVHTSERILLLIWVLTSYSNKNQLTKGRNKHQIINGYTSWYIVIMEASMFQPGKWVNPSSCSQCPNSETWHCIVVWEILGKSPGPKTTINFPMMPKWLLILPRSIKKEKGIHFKLQICSDQH